METLNSVHTLKNKKSRKFSNQLNRVNTKFKQFLYDYFCNKNVSKDDSYEKFSYGISVKTVIKNSLLRESIMILDPRNSSIFMFINKKCNEIIKVKINDITQISLDQERSNLKNQNNFLSIFLREHTYNIIFNNIDDLDAFLYILSDVLLKSEKQKY